jgi:hypothetical protein
LAVEDEVEPELDVPGVLLDVDEAAEGRLDSEGSATKLAVVPVSFEQTDCVAVAAPATKLTAAHWMISAFCWCKVSLSCLPGREYRRAHLARFQAHPSSRRKTLELEELARKSYWGRFVEWQAEDWSSFLKLFGLMSRGTAKLPVDGWISAKSGLAVSIRGLLTHQGKYISTNMKVCNIVLAEVDSKSSTRSGVFDWIIKSNTWGIKQEEMTGRLANQACKKAPSERG